MKNLPRTVSYLALLLLTAGLFGCYKKKASVVREIPMRTAEPGESWQASTECRSCHEQAYVAWQGSHHAKAHRSISPELDQALFTPPTALTLHDTQYQLDWKEDKPVFAETYPGKAPFNYTAEYVLGHTPLYQYIVPIGKGHYQASEIARDATNAELFNVFGGERRRPGEWGHWRGRGMNWNSMCAHCHITSFRKNYDAATDTYASKWLEQGVGCVQCHGSITAAHRQPLYHRPETTIPPFHLDKARITQTCAPCHARNELLTGQIEPGANYNDHYRLTLPVQENIFYPDGQVRDEDFNYTSLLTSRMGGIKGVGCSDCHDAHTGKTRLPSSDNSICMQCHTAPGRDGAPIIDPTAHSHHGKPAEAKGNLCVECHMPTTTYMQRDPRHDHGFLKPDPLLTKELGIPNACNRCHTDKSVDWAIEKSVEWYGQRLEGRQRERARLVSRLQKEDPLAHPLILPALKQEDVPAWLASLIHLARPYAPAQPEIQAFARAQLTHPEPMVRSAAVQLLSEIPGQQDTIRPLLKDPVRLVRLDAEQALTAELDPASPERRELDAYLALGLNQPGGRVRLAMNALSRGDNVEAEKHARAAINQDQESPGLYEALGTVLNAANKPAAAATEMLIASERLGDAGLAFLSALGWAAVPDLKQAETAFRKAIALNPNLDRAWYNLGLLLAQSDRATESVDYLKKAEQLQPGNPDYPYALATVFINLGQKNEARAAATRALKADPTHRGAQQILALP